MQYASDGEVDARLLFFLLEIHHFESSAENRVGCPKCPSFRNFIRAFLEGEDAGGLLLASKEEGTWLSESRVPGALCIFAYFFSPSTRKEEEE